jgi:ADP-ribosylglycohydrolase
MEQDKITGCLIGVAIGDALGAPFESLPPQGRITDFHPYGSFPKGSWTDDTGMTLATCRGLIEHARDERSVEECLRDSFKIWSESDECRCPGHTVYHAAKYGVPDLNSWANGALMRTAPVAIFAHVNGDLLPDTAKLALKVPELTHNRPLATFPAVEMVLCLMSIFAGEKKVPKYISDPSQFVRVTYDNQEQQYREYREMRRLPLDSISKTTGLYMWKQVLEVLGLAEGKPWSIMPTFEKGILKAVNQCFDRDTAVAVAGAILGAYWGLNKIPLHWRDQVEKADVIVGLAAELMQACGKPGKVLTPAPKKSKFSVSSPLPPILHFKFHPIFFNKDFIGKDSNRPKGLYEHY